MDSLSILTSWDTLMKIFPLALMEHLTVVRILTFLPIFILMSMGYKVDYQNILAIVAGQTIQGKCFI